MLVGLNDSNIVTNIEIKEPEINRDASNYIVDNYMTVLKIVRTYDIDFDKAPDLVHDVYISLVESEDNGDCFDETFSNREKKDDEMQILSVAQFVLGRCKQYAKNSRYRSNVVDEKITTITEEEVVYDTELDEFGNEVLDRNGNVKRIKRIVKTKKPVSFITVASTPDESNSEDTNDDFQKAYANASVSDSSEDVEDIASLRSQIDYCIDICDINGINVINIFKNIDLLESKLGDKKSSFESVFKQINELGKYHDEFFEAFRNVLMFSSKHRSIFESVLATY